MTKPIIVYAFESEGDKPASDYRTQSIDEARSVAKSNGWSIVANEYEWADSELVEDYRPGHNLDGTPKVRRAVGRP